MSFAVMALITVNSAKKLIAPHTDLIDLQTDSVHIANIQKEINPYGQVSVERKFAYTYDPDVKAAVEKQEKQEEAFAVPSVRAINGKGNANNNVGFQQPSLAQKAINPFGQVSVERKFAYTYDPDVKAAVEKQEKQEEAFAVPSIRAINGKGNADNNVGFQQPSLVQSRTLPDTTQNAPGTAYEAGVKGLSDEPIRESSEVFSNSNGEWGTGNSKIGGDPIEFSQKAINPFGQVSVERKFAYTYDPDVKAAVEKQEKQEEAFAVPSIRAINGKGNADNNVGFQQPSLAQKAINPFGQVSVERKFAYTYDPDVKAAVEKQEKQEEAFAVPSIRAINGKGNADNNVGFQQPSLVQSRTLPDTTQNAPGVAYETGVAGLSDEPIRESSEVFSNSNGEWGTGNSKIGGDPIEFAQHQMPTVLFQKAINPYGQVSVERKFAYTYDPDVKAAVEAQEKQEEAFAVPSVRAINGKGNANNNVGFSNN